MEQDILITYKTIPKDQCFVFCWWIRSWDYAVSQHPWRISPSSDIRCYLFSERLTDWDKRTFSKVKSPHCKQRRERCIMISTPCHLIRFFGIKILPVCWWRLGNVITFASVTQNIRLIRLASLQFVEREMEWMQHGTWLYFYTLYTYLYTL